MANETTLTQRVFLIAQLELLFRRVQKTIIDMTLSSNMADRETRVDLIYRFTDIQDEHDDLIDGFRQMLQENTAENTPQQQNTDATTVQAPTQLNQSSNSQY